MSLLAGDDSAPTSILIILSLPSDPLKITIFSQDVFLSRQKESKYVSTFFSISFTFTFPFFQTLTLTCPSSSRCTPPPSRCRSAVFNKRKDNDRFTPVFPSPSPFRFPDTRYSLSLNILPTPSPFSPSLFPLPILTCFRFHTCINLAFSENEKSVKKITKRTSAQFMNVTSANIYSSEEQSKRNSAKMEQKS